MRTVRAALRVLATRTVGSGVLWEFLLNPAEPTSRSIGVVDAKC